MFSGDFFLRCVSPLLWRAGLSEVGREQYAAASQGGGSVRRGAGQAALGGSDEQGSGSSVARAERAF